MKSKWIIISVMSSLLMITVLMALSYLCARRTADQVIAPISAEVCHIGSRFLPIGVKGRPDGPSWWISYEPDAIVIAPLSIQLDLFGNLIWTNPEDLQERIRKNQEENTVEQDNPGDS